jgi:hypothetical protein
VVDIFLSVKSTITTATRTTPRNGARSAAAERIARSDVSGENSSGGMITPSSRPIARGLRATATRPSIGERVLRRREISSRQRFCSVGLGATAQKSSVW